MSIFEASDVATLLVVLVGISSTPLSSFPTKKDTIGINNNLTYLGAVDGKWYFYEKYDRSWTEGERICNESEMRLATITSKEQAEFLRNSSAILGSSGYWVAAQETQILSRFAWKHDGESLDDTLVPLSPDWPPPVAQCLLYLILDSVAQYYAFPCSETIYTLCEINPG